MMRVPVIAVSILVSSCSTVASVYDARSGETHHEINCSGPSPTSWSTCQVKAEKICPAGYDIVATTREPQAAVTIGSDRRMTVRCR